MLTQKFYEQAAIALGSSILSVGLTLAVIVPHEGKRNKAYKDPVGVTTICFGHTKTAQMGQTKTDQECYELLVEDLKETSKALDYVTVPLTPHLEAALRSFIFNVGSSAFRNSTLLKKLNKKDYQGACDELQKWIKATDRRTNTLVVLPGLVKRRANERDMCMVGL